MRSLQFSFCLTAAITLLIHTSAFSQVKDVTVIPVDSGWAKNSVNAVVFRKNSLTTWKDTQYISYYDREGYVVIGKRNTKDAAWRLHKTMFKGNVQDAHNAISIATDGSGYVHISWDHHNTMLKYARSLAPGSLEFASMKMTGLEEERVSYPEFYRLSNGNLVFFYRSGESGKGKLIINSYDQKTQTWTRLQNNLIDGEEQRSAYWQSFVDNNGTIHISWVWRETSDVASNHDLCYARSSDFGHTWTKSTGETYSLPITATIAEYVFRIPENRELINQTSMTTDEEGNPFIATYWKSKSDQAPQYHIAYLDRNNWKDLNTGFRKTTFTLSGIGTKSIAISRPQIVVKGKGSTAEIFMIFRDADRRNKPSLYHQSLNSQEFEISDLTSENLGAWEPTLDVDRWKTEGILNVFMQHVRQADAEGITSASAQMVSVLEWKPDNKK